MEHGCDIGRVRLVRSQSRWRGTNATDGSSFPRFVAASIGVASRLSTDGRKPSRWSEQRRTNLPDELSRQDKEMPWAISRVEGSSCRLGSHCSPQQCLASQPSPAIKPL